MIHTQAATCFRSVNGFSNRVELAFQPCQDAVANGADAVLAAFALEDLQGLALAIEVVEGELGEFAA